MKVVYLCLLAVGLAACGKSAAASVDGAKDGPASIEVPDLTVSTDPAVIQKGQEIFASKGCIGCHKLGGGKLVGPDLEGVTKRRTIPWIARMILRPDVMVQEDPVAKDLLKTYMTPMANQNVSPDTELPELLAYLKSRE